MDNAETSVIPFQPIREWTVSFLCHLRVKQAVAPRSGPLQFDFVKDWTTRYSASAINSNAVNSTGLGLGLRPALAAAS